MGAQISKLKNLFVGTRELRVLMLGLDAAGKTTILYRLGYKNNPVITTIPTVGFNVETISYKNFKFNCWDVGGQDKIRPLWRHYYSGTEALIFVVDSTDHNRIAEACQELNRILADPELHSVRVLVLANKQDLPGAMSDETVKEKLKMEGRSQQWSVQPTIAVEGEGVYNGFEWLMSTFKKSTFETR